MPVTATLVPDRPAIRLSSSLTLKAAFEGPAPLRVEVPSEVLSDESAQVWQIAPVGSAKLVDLPGGTQRWSQDFKLSPFAPGDAVPLALREFSVTAGGDAAPKSIAFPALTIRVETSIKSIGIEEARPITGIEELPPLPPRPAIPPGVIGFAIAVVLLLLVGSFFALRRRRPMPELPPGERAQRELDALVPDATLPEKLAAILRAFAADAFDLPAETMTTAELAEAHPDEELRRLLEACDRAKFAGITWRPDDGLPLKTLGGAWLARVRSGDSGMQKPA